MRISQKKPRGTLSDFMTNIALMTSYDQSDDAPGQITLMTLHMAKGLEFDFVFLTGLEEGILPHEMSLKEKNGIEEERRLAYVGMTRAKKFFTFLLVATENDTQMGCACRVVLG